MWLLCKCVFFVVKKVKSVNLALPTPYISERCIKIKDKSFHTSLWCHKRFFEGLKGFYNTFWGTANKCENKNLS